MCDALVEATCVIWRMSGAGKEDKLKEMVLRLANPGYFTKDKRCFHCGATDHMRHHCPKCKDNNRTKCNYPVCLGWL